MNSNIKRNSTFVLALTSALGVGLVGNSSDVGAAVNSGTLDVTATVSANCVFKGGGAAGTLAFGSYDPVSTNASTALDVASSFQVRCTKGTSATIGMDLGSNATGSTRRLINGSEYLTYEVYKDSGRTTVWTTSGGGLLSFSPNTNAFQNVPVYGRVPAGQDISAGNYADTINMAVNF